MKRVIIIKSKITVYSVLLLILGVTLLLIKPSLISIEIIIFIIWISCIIPSFSFWILFYKKKLENSSFREGYFWGYNADLFLLILPLLFAPLFMILYYIKY